MTRKDRGIAMKTLAELMKGSDPWPPSSPPMEPAPAVKMHQDARRAAMIQQRNPKVETFPVGNRAARRLAGSKKAEKPL